MAQTRVYAATVASHATADNTPLGIDQDLTTRARVRANAGVALGIGAYEGHIELKFPSVLPPNTTSYVKIQTDEELLPHLVGGSLGNLLADVVSAVLAGKQEFTVQAKSGNSVVLEGKSQAPSEFAGDRLKIVVNATGEYFLKITPAVSYDRIRLISRTGGALVGGGATKHLDVFEAFYNSGSASCGTGAYTSFSGSGISLDVLKLGQAGVRQPSHAIDANTTNFSTLSLGLLGVGASIEQTIYFDGLSGTADEYRIRLRLAQGLLNLNVANSIKIIASNGGTVVKEQTLASLLTLHALSLTGGQVAAIPIQPGAPVDRITVRFSSLVSVSIAQELDIFGITRSMAPPVPAAVAHSVCRGSAASLSATASVGNMVMWHDAPEGGNMLGMTTSGAVFITPAINGTTTFYVSQGNGSCESARIPLTVTSKSCQLVTNPMVRQRMRSN